MMSPSHLIIPPSHHLISSQEYEFTDEQLFGMGTRRMLTGDEDLVYYDKNDAILQLLGLQFITAVHLAVLLKKLPYRDRVKNVSEIVTEAMHLLNWLIPMITIYALDMNISCSNSEGACDATPAVLQILVTMVGVAVALAKEILSIAPILSFQLTQTFATKVRTARGRPRVHRPASLRSLSLRGAHDAAPVCRKRPEPLVIEPAAPSDAPDPGRHARGQAGLLRPGGPAAGREQAHEEAADRPQEACAWTAAARREHS